MDGIFRNLIRLGELVKPYKGPFLGAGVASFLTAIASSFYDYFYRGLNPLPAVLIPLVISLTFLFCWFQTYEKWYQILARRLLRSQFKNPKIAILSVRGIDEIETKKLLRSTVYTPEDWYSHLCSNNISAEKTIDLSMKNDCFIILNPFGELYLEEDTTNLKTFQKIKEYIKNGGVFVNTAGLAFWYMQNPKKTHDDLTGSMVETYEGEVITEPIEWNPETKLERFSGPKLQTNEEGVRTKLKIHLTPVVIPGNSYLTDTWLYKNFGVHTTLGDKRPLKAKNAAHFDIIEGESEVLEFRSALRCESAEAQLIPIIQGEFEYQKDRKVDCYPIAAVKYGRGYLILNGMVLEEEKHLLLVVEVIKKIIERLREEGALEL
jgi:hypothetical protein